MVRTVGAFSKNIDISFKYAREDLNTLKMKSSFLQEKINELKKIDKEVKIDISELKRLVNAKEKKQVKPASKKSVMKSIKKEFTKKNLSKKNPELQFYDVKARKRFSSKNYKETIKNKTLFAVAKSPFGNYECYRILKKV